MSRQVEAGDWSALTGGSVAVDVIDRENTIEVAADLPGFDRDDIDITLSGDQLRIEATREPDVEEPEVRYLRRERGDRTMKRSIRLPDAVDDESASATYSGGVLRIELPKVDPREEGRQIDID